MAKELKQWIFDLCGLMSVSGHESYDHERLSDLVAPIFDEVYTDPVGNQIMVKKCGRPNAPRILLDAHFDEIGMIVREILDGGFVRVERIGGLDARMMAAAEVILYGKEKVFGVIASTPPHLQKAGDSEKLPAITDLLIDTGYSKEELQAILPIGSPIGFPPKYEELQNGRITGKAFDNKACGACMLSALETIDSKDLAGDVYVQFSAQEEPYSNTGAGVGAYRIKPDYAMCVDVNLGRTPDTPKTETVLVGEGLSLTLGPVVNRELNACVKEMAKGCNLKLQPYVAAGSTGTNAPRIALSGTGVPTVDIGLPIKYMHTYHELLDLKDAQDLVTLVRAFVTDSKTAEVFAHA